MRLRTNSPSSAPSRVSIILSCLHLTENFEAQWLRNCHLPLYPSGRAIPFQSLATPPTSPLSTSLAPPLDSLLWPDLTCSLQGRLSSFTLPNFCSKCLFCLYCPANISLFKAICPGRISGLTHWFRISLFQTLKKLYP